MIDKIRVLVVDDSAFMRRVISDMINNEPDIIVVDTARDGEDAVKKALAIKPDVITLDVEMPKKNGLETLKEIKKTLDCQIIMLSSLTSEGSYITIEALREGAFDFIQKPSGAISLDIAKVKDDLINKIRYAYSNRKKQFMKMIFKDDTSPVISQNAKDTSNMKIDAILLAASTGGPRVLYDVITKLPGDLNVPIFVVQHMPAGFTKTFAERIDKNSNIFVKEAENGEKIVDNRVYIAPGGYHMLVAKGTINLELSPTLHGVRPAADMLFISAVECFKGNLLACVFTGMGKDGANGVKSIKKSGGYIIAQDENTSIVYGMPKAAYETGCVDAVLPDYKIPNEIVRVVKRRG